MSKISKNQRAGVRQAPRAPCCPRGHALVRVLVVPVKGRRRLEWRHVNLDRTCPS